MCGRYTLTETAELGTFFEISDTRLPPRFNVAPTQQVPVVRQTADGSRELCQMRWGLIDPWGGGGQTGHINARSESVADKPAFAAAFAARRCLVPADGFFEWQKAGGMTHPYFIRRRDSGLFALAAIWEANPSSGDNFAVLTCPAPEELMEIHHRVPVMLQKHQCATWLDPESTPAKLEALLEPYPMEQIEAVPVGRTVNSVANDSQACIEPQAHRHLQGRLF